MKASSKTENQEEGQSDPYPTGRLLSTPTLSYAEPNSIAEGLRHPEGFWGRLIQRDPKGAEGGTGFLGFCLGSILF